MDTSTFIEIIREAGYEPYSYSGRNMYGDSCVGFTTDDTLPATIANLLNSVLYEMISDEETIEKVTSLTKIIRNATTDNMGLSTVVYFPRVKWEEE